MTDPSRRHSADDDAVKARRQRRGNENLEIVIGVLGFFAVAALVTTVLAEVRGEPALREAFVLLCFVVALGIALRARRRRKGPPSA